MVISTENALIDAHNAGVAYWVRNKPYDATSESLTSYARTLGWHGDCETWWLIGFYSAKHCGTCNLTSIEE